MFDGNASGAAVDRRIDGGVAHLHGGGVDSGFGRHNLGAGALDGGFVGEHRLGERVGAGSHLVGLFTRDHALIEQSAIPCSLVLRVFFVGDIARQIRLRLAERRSIAGQVRLRLAELGVERPGIDSEEQIALLHRIAFMKRDLGELAAYLGFHRDCRIGFHISDDIDVDGHVALGDHGHYDRNGSAVATPSPAARPSLRSRLIAATEGQHQGECQGRYSQLRKCFANFHEDSHPTRASVYKIEERASA